MRNLYGITSKRQAIAFVRDCANGIIEQQERRAKGWDKGVYRDDDVMRLFPIARTLVTNSQEAFAVARQWS